MRRAQVIAVTIMVGLVASTVLSRTTRVAQASRAREILWRDPGNMSSRDLYYGPGSRALSPQPPFRFIEEDTSGTTPKFKMKDARNVEWSVKLGRESQSETVATRFVWALGYFAEDAYYYPRVRINSLPRLSRGGEFIDPGGFVRQARMESRRTNIKRGDSWSWRENPFVGTREFNGLRVMMILLNNWDVKDTNNRVLIVTDPRNKSQEVRYAVTDLGATLGRAGAFGGKRSKNDLEDFISSSFVTGVDDGMVDFDYDPGLTGVGWASIVYPPQFRKHWNKEKAMDDIPVRHARWIAGYLAQLSDSQMHDAFRAAHYDRSTSTAYVRALRQRINQLRYLQDRDYQLARVN